MTSSDPVPQEKRFPRRIQAGIVVALAVWGIYLAVGATGVFTDVGLFDLRRSMVVLACSALFLGFWMIISVLPPKDAEKVAQTNWSSVISFGLTLVAFLLWAISYAVWQGGRGQSATTVLGWLSFALMAIASLLSLIGLSDPRPRRGKLFGLASIALLALAVVLFIWQVNRYLSGG